MKSASTKITFALIAAAAVSFTVAAPSLQAMDVGVGAQYSADPEWILAGAPGARSLTWWGLGNVEKISLRAWPYPLQLGFGAIYSFASSSGGFWNLAMTADWWLLQGRPANSAFGYYFGVGLSVTFPVVALSARVPMGLRWWPLPGTGLETYLEFVPSAGGFVWPWAVASFGAQVGFGARYWLKIGS